MANFFQNLMLTSYMWEIWLSLLAAFIFGFAFDMCCTLDTPLRSQRFNFGYCGLAAFFFMYHDPEEPGIHYCDIETF